mmetsp:Transcript_54358/g.129524  ORF Transcript_54358/g.129524 Transcript_54358/m.129524 type:complete len:287 (-) Transcript_54358:353-1213(-)
MNTWSLRPTSSCALLQCLHLVIQLLPLSLQTLALLLVLFFVLDCGIAILRCLRNSPLISVPKFLVLFLQDLNAALQLVPLSLVLAKDFVGLRQSILEVVELAGVRLQLAAQVLLRTDKLLILSGCGRFSRSLLAVQLGMLGQLCRQSLHLNFMFLLLLRQLLVSPVVLFEEQLEPMPQVFVLSSQLHPLVCLLVHLLFHITNGVLEFVGKLLTPDLLGLGQVPSLFCQCLRLLLQLSAQRLQLSSNTENSCELSLAFIPLLLKRLELLELGFHLLCLQRCLFMLCI